MGGRVRTRGPEVGRMSKTFVCYLHKPDTPTPELRIVSCGDGEGIAEVIAAKMPVWPAFDLLEVFDEQDNPILRLSSGARPGH
jgi:hypothetical protein